MAGIADIAVAPLSTAANYFLQRDAAARNQQYYRENIAENFKYSQQAQRNAAANEVIGLRNAGLSPALANGAAGASQVSAQGGTMQAPTFDPSNMLLMAQIENLKAQTDKVESEKASVDIDNANKKGQNATLGQNMAMYFNKLADETADKDLANFFRKQAEFAESGEFTKGNYDAYLNYLDVQGKNEEAIARKADKKLSAWLSELRWNAAKGKAFDDPFVKSLASLDVRQSDLLAEQVSNLIAQRKNVDKDTELVGAKVSLTNAQIEQVKAAAEALKDSNVLDMIEKGDYGKALVAMLLQIFSGAASRGVGYVQ